MIKYRIATMENTHKPLNNWCILGQTRELMGTFDRCSTFFPLSLLSIVDVFNVWLCCFFNSWVSTNTTENKYQLLRKNNNKNKINKKKLQLSLFATSYPICNLNYLYIHYGNWMTKYFYGCIDKQFIINLNGFTSFTYD